MSFTIPFGAEPVDRKPCASEPGHEILNAPGMRTGRWQCTLRTLEPLSIKAVFEPLAPRRPAYIPGSSIRGMVRNVAEMMGAGCGRYYDDDMKLPDNLTVCNEGAACQVCRIFGFTDGEYAWASKVRFSDTEPLLRTPWVRLEVPNQREALTDNGRGWRTFRSYGGPTGYGPHVYCVDKKAEFRFMVDYRNLSEEQFDLLLFCLTLQDGNEQSVHKLGYAKSLDLGACLIFADGGARPGLNLKKYLDRPGYEDYFYRKRGQ
jgi:hypothetical protein